MRVLGPTAFKFQEIIRVIDYLCWFVGVYFIYCWFLVVLRFRSLRHNVLGCKGMEKGTKRNDDESNLSY